MFEELLNSAWFAPLLICLIQVYQMNKSAEKEKEFKRNWETWQNLQKFIEQNSVHIAQLEKELSRLEMEAAGKYLPRSEFNDFLEKLDRTLQRDREELEKHISMLIENLINKTVKGEKV